MGRELQMGPDDVFPALASFAFDMCIPELYLALVTGGRVVVGGRHLASNGEELADGTAADGSYGRPRHADDLESAAGGRLQRQGTEASHRSRAAAAGVVHTLVGG